MKELGGDERVVLPLKKRRQHHVWQHYLTPWVVDGDIHCLRNGRIFHTGTTNVAVERDFYKLHPLTPRDLAMIELLAIDKAKPLLKRAHRRFLDDLQAPMRIVAQTRRFILNPDEVDAYIDIYMNNILEDHHALIENSFVPLLEKASQRDIAFYEDDELCIGFLHFICSQFMRTKGAKVKTINLIKDKQGLDLTSIWDVLCYMFTLNSSASLYLERKKRKLVLVENRTDLAFITGDQPVVNLYHAGELTPPTKLSFYYPISPSLALILGEVDEEPMFSSETLTAVQVSALNVRMIEACHEQAFGHSEAALRPFLEG